MKRLLTLLALVLCSCAETFVGEEIARSNNENLPDLTAEFAEEDATRTYIENGKYLRWCEDDRLTVFFGNTLNRQYKFNGKTGDNSGTFSLVPDGMLGTGNTLNRIYALYPYSSDASISDEGVISLTLPSTQTYAENSFGISANTMVAVTENLEDTFLAFKNACGYLKLKLYNAEGAKLKSIEVKGNNGEKIAGDATLSINFGETPTLTMAESATDAVILDCGNGVALGTTAEEATELWVVLPATTFAEGLTITATDTEGKVFKKSTTKEVIIERNAIQPMAALEAEFVLNKPANNEIWYTNGRTTTATMPNKTYVFGASIVSNTYDAEKECWVIKFDGEVTKIGDDAFYNCSSLTSVTIPDSVTTIGYEAFRSCRSLTSVTIGDSVTTIGDWAFAYCSSLTSVTIGDSVTTIGNDAFYNCSSLTSVTIPDSVTTIGNYAFEDCSSLTSITIGDSVTTVGEKAFAYCSSLTSVTIPDSVTTIGNDAFYECCSLISVTIGKGVTTIGSELFYGCTGELEVNCNIRSSSYYYNSVFYGSEFTTITIGDSVTTIGDYAFYGCSSLTSVTIPDSVTSIGDYAFYYCSSLTSVTIGDSVTTIGNYAFYNCSSLTSVTIPDSVTTIGYEAFYHCSSLTSVTIPDSVTTIGWRAFYGCGSLTSVTIPDSVTTIGDAAFSYCSSLIEFKGKFAEENGRMLVVNGVLKSFARAGLTEYTITIPDSVTRVGNYAFSGCSSLTSVTIPDSVTEIGDYAFSGCSSLISITIPDSVTEIGYKAFSGCVGDLIICSKIIEKDYDHSISGNDLLCESKFTSLTIGDNIDKIGDYAFQSCSSLTSVTIGDSVTTIGDYAFYKCSSLTSITIPDSVATIGNYAFEYCTNLTEFKGKFATNDGRGLIMNGTLLAVAPAGLTEFTTPDSVTTIGNGAFGGCSSLTSVTIGDSVTTIGNAAFWYCSSLTSITIPDSVTTIGSSAFYGCRSLTSVTIPDSVTTIGNDAFYECWSLISVYCKATTPPEVDLDYYDDWDAFDSNAVGRKIYVPTESVSKYKSASYWDEYASAIVGYDFETGKIVYANYSIDLNNAWRQSTSISNPDSSLYDGVYESYSNYNVDNGVATMYIDIEGYTEFSIYVRSNAESSYDYVTVSELDSTTAKTTTSGNQSSGTAISNYTKVTYTGIDGGSHRITVTYRKDGSVNNGTDRGYLIIPKNQ